MSGSRHRSLRRAAQGGPRSSPNRPARRDLIAPIASVAPNRRRVRHLSLLPNESPDRNSLAHGRLGPVKVMRHLAALALAALTFAILNGGAAQPESRRPVAIQTIVQLRLADTAGSGRRPNPTGCDPQHPVPASFAVGPDGETVSVLDQHPPRIRVFRGGQLVRTLSLASSSFEDMLLLDNGNYVLVDRQSSTLLVMSQDGVELQRAPFVRGEAKSDRVWESIHLRRDGVWLYAVDLSARAVTVNGEIVAPREPRAGVPTDDGKWLYGVRSRADNSAEILQRPNAPLATQQRALQLQFENPSQFVSASDADSVGNLYLLTEFAQPELAERRQLIVLTPDFEVLRRIEVAPTCPRSAAFRRMVVWPNGRVFLPQLSADSVRVTSY